MLRRNSKNKQEAIRELHDIMLEREMALADLRKLLKEGNTNVSLGSSQAKMYHWMKKYRSLNEWNKTKSFWRKLF